MGCENVDGYVYALEMMLVSLISVSAEVIQ